MDNLIKALNHLDEKVSVLDEHVTRIDQQLEQIKKRPDVLFKEEWIDGQDVMLALNICPRTLQTLRDKGIINPTRLLRKYYYKVSDIKAQLKKNYIRYQLKQNHRKEVVRKQ